MEVTTMAMFAKRHFEAIATVMQNTHPGFDEDCLNYDETLETWKTIREELAATFARDNSRFQAERFKLACLPGNSVTSRSRFAVTEA
jgi:hypothetical protein